MSPSKPTPSSLKLTGSTTDKPGPAPTAADELLSEHGFSPNDWEVSSLRIGSWEAQAAEGETRHLSTVRGEFRPRGSDPAALLAVPPIKVRHVKRRLARHDSTLWAFLSDQHCGAHHDEEVHALVCDFLREHQPEQLACIGDLLDYESVSKYSARDPRAVACLNTGLTVGRRYLAQYSAALPEDTRKIYIPGNHEFRLNRFLSDRAPALVGLVSPDGADVFSERYLLGLDDLGYETTEGGYPNDRIEVVEDKLYALHGHKASQKAGTSTHKHTDRTLHAVIHGHTHRLALVHRTMWQGQRAVTQQSAEIGHLSIQDVEGHGYAPENDWQQGFATCEVFGDGEYQIDLVRVVGEPGNKSLLWRGKRLSPALAAVA